MHSRRRRWPGRLLKVAVAVVLGLIVLGVVGKYWIVPVVVRWQVASRLADYWDGQADIEEVEFNYSGPIRLGGLSLQDAAGRQWLRVGSVEVKLGGWPGLSPYLKVVEVDRVVLTGHWVGGKCTPPLRRPEKREPKEDKGPIQTEAVRVRGVSVTLIDHDTGNRAEWKGFDLAATRRGRDFEITLNQRHGDGTARELASGTIDADTLAGKVRMKFKEAVGGAKVATLLEAVRFPGVRRLDGGLHVDVTVTGVLNKLDSLRADGTVGLENWRLAAGDGKTIADADVALQLSGREGTVEAKVATSAWRVDTGRVLLSFDPGKPAMTVGISTWVADFPGGEPGAFWAGVLDGHRLRGRVTVTGTVSLVRGARRPLDFDLHVTPDLKEVVFPAPYGKYNMTDAAAKDIRLRPTRVTVVDFAARLPAGNAKLSADLTLRPDKTAPDEPPALADWATLERLDGRAWVFADDVHSLAVPILAAVFDTIVPGQVKAHTKTDVESVLTLRDGIVTIERGRVANPISALQAEKGGTVDLKTGQLDLYVVGVSLNVLRAVLKRIPLLNLAVEFKDRLARVRVKGHWSEPPEKLIRKEPLKDLETGMADFFKGVLKTGGQMGPDLLKGFSDFFKKLEPTTTQDAGT